MPPRLLHFSRVGFKPIAYLTFAGASSYLLYKNLPILDAASASRTANPNQHAQPLIPKYTKLASRAEQLARLREAGEEEEQYDLLVVGGGATGCGIALDAASRGLNVALVEREDFSAGTSSKSTKLVHGGVRYLEKAVKELDYNQYILVREALRERAVFLKTAPHLSMSLPIMLPIYQWWKVPYFWAGTKAYDWLAGKENLESSYFLTKSKALSAFPMLKENGLVGALVYYDGAHNDSRMNVALATTAALYGATVLNYANVDELLKDETGKIVGAKVSDLMSERKGGERITVRAKGVINATGPFCDSVRKLDDPFAPEIVAPSAGTHLVLPGYYSPASMGLIDPATSDGRVIFFLPWQGNTIAGTTDSPTAITQNPLPKEEEIEWILNEVRRYLSPEIRVRRGDVLAAWTGIRPLVRDPSAKNTESLVRNHLMNVSKDGLLTVAGGKWTTYRQMAEEAVDEAIKVYNLKPGPKPRPTPPADGETEGLLPFVPIDGKCKTQEIELVGAHGYSPNLFIALIQNYGVETTVAKHLTTSYGDRAWEVCALSAQTGQRFPVRGIRLSTLYPFIDGEVRYAVRHEYAQTAVDVVARRTRLAFLNVQAALEALPSVIDIMAEELKWNKTRKQEEWDKTVKYLESMGLPEVWKGISRKEVESGRVSHFDSEEDYKLYARHDGPAA